MKDSRIVVREGPFKSVIPDGVKIGNFIHLSGHVSVTESGDLVGRGDVGEQVRQVYSNIAKTLSKFGASMSDIVDETLFVTDIDRFLNKEARTFDIRRKVFGGEPQVSQTLVQVARLASPEWLVEIKCIAQLPRS
jgi:2-iminobutanoate/2-iminopropanoate deaminase